MTALRFSGFLLVLVTLTGCRLYGGHGTTEALRADVDVVVSDMRAMQDQAARDLAKIERVSNTNARDFLTNYRSAVETQGEELEASIKMASDVAESGGYRKVSRVLGALISEREIARDRYRAILIDHARNAGLPVPASLKDNAPIQTVPAYYQRSSADSVPGVDVILAALSQ